MGQNPEHNHSSQNFPFAGYKRKRHRRFITVNDQTELAPDTDGSLITNSRFVKDVKKGEEPEGFIPIGDGTKGFVPIGDGTKGFVPTGDVAKKESDPIGDHNKGIVCFGKSPAITDTRTLALRTYLPADLPQPRPSRDWGKYVASWPMYDNDKYANCTCAAAAHMIQAWTAAAGNQTVARKDNGVDGKADKAGETPSLQDVLSFYEHFTAPGSKNGCKMLSVLKYWRKYGLGGNKIVAFLALELRNSIEVMDAISIFGGCYIGLSLPKFAVNTSHPLAVDWVVPPEGTIGAAAPDPQLGHCVSAVAYDPRNIYVVTWGEVKRMSWQFYNAYADEAYAILSNDFFDSATGKSASRFNQDELLTDLAELAYLPSTSAGISARV